MSYDLAVFDVAAAPKERIAFMEWFARQTRWAEPRDYNDPRGATPALAARYSKMTQEFSAMNGPHRWMGDWTTRKSVITRLEHR